jgi:hypothetical protein
MLEHIIRKSRAERFRIQEKVEDRRELPMIASSTCGLKRRGMKRVRIALGVSDGELLRRA